MAKAQKKAPVPQLPTPAQELETHKKHLMETLPEYLNMFEEAVEKFKQAAQGNPISAMQWEGKPAMLGMHVDQQCIRSGLKQLLPTIVDATNDQMKNLRQRQEWLQRDLLRYDGYRPNSTCPFTNVENQQRFRAEQIVCSLLKWVVWELEYVRLLEKKVEDVEETLEPEHNPYELL